MDSTIAHSVLSVIHGDECMIEFVSDLNLLVVRERVGKERIGPCGSNGERDVQKGAVKVMD
jgi:hypothetical protein